MIYIHKNTIQRKRFDTIKWRFKNVSEWEPSIKSITYDDNCNFRWFQGYNLDRQIICLELSHICNVLQNQTKTDLKLISSIRPPCVSLDCSKEQRIDISANCSFPWSLHLVITLQYIVRQIIQNIVYIKGCLRMLNTYLIE